MVGIYKISSPSGRIYIGQSWDTRRRWRDYNNKQSTIVGRSFSKYGKENHSFEVIHELPVDVDQRTLDAYEQLYMDLHTDASIVLMNLREAGSRGKHKEGSKIKMSISGKGKVISDESKAKMSLAKRGRKMPPEFSITCSLARKGSSPQRKTIEAAIAVNKGSKRTQEARIKMSLAKKGKPWSEERRKAQTKVK